MGSGAAWARWRRRIRAHAGRGGPGCRSGSGEGGPVKNPDELRRENEAPGDRISRLSAAGRARSRGSPSRFRWPTRPGDEGFLGARASPPHQAWHSLDHLPQLDHPGTAPWLSFGLADAVPADRVAACSIALKLSGGQRDQDAGGTPALPGDAVPAARWGCLAGDFSESRRAPFGKLPFAT